MGSNAEKVSEKVVKCKADVASSNVISTVIKNKVHRTRYVYNMKVKPSEVDALKKV